MKLRNVLPRLAILAKDFFSPEGSWRGPFAGLGEFGGVYPIEPTGDGWQRNLEVPSYGVRRIPAAYAAVMANATAVSQCWPRHLRETKAKQFERVTSSPAFRVFRKPNDYETWPVFILNLIAAMQFDGTGYAVALRDENNKVTSLHRTPRNGCQPFISPISGEVFYSIGHNELTPDFHGSISGLEYVVPASDVMALRQFCPRHPLRGESPATAAALAMGVNVALSQSQAVFFSRMSRPSGVLVSEQQLNAQQIERARENWNSQSALLAQGGVPVLGNGMKWVPMTITSEDSQLIEAQRMSIEDIARVYRVPLPVIGDLSHSTLTNVEALINFWLATGLGSLLELVERAFDDLFGFDTVTEYTDFDTTALLRTDFAARIDALCKAIQGGLYKPDEARATEGLGPVPGGDKVYVQKQMVPLGTTVNDLADPGQEPSTGAEGTSAGQEPAQEPPKGEGEGADKGLSPEALTAALMERLGVGEVRP